MRAFRAQTPLVGQRCNDANTTDGSSKDVPKRAAIIGECWPGARELTQRNGRPCRQCCGTGAGKAQCYKAPVSTAAAAAAPRWASPMLPTPHCPYHAVMLHAPLPMPCSYAPHTTLPMGYPANALDFFLRGITFQCVPGKQDLACGPISLWVPKAHVIGPRPRMRSLIMLLCSQQSAPLHAPHHHALLDPLSDHSDPRSHNPMTMMRSQAVSATANNPMRQRATRSWGE